MILISIIGGNLLIPIKITAIVIFFIGFPHYFQQLWKTLAIKWEKLGNNTLDF